MHRGTEQALHIVIKEPPFILQDQTYYPFLDNPNYPIFLAYYPPPLTYYPRIILCMKTTFLPKITTLPCYPTYLNTSFPHTHFESI